jgi:hypothetical protein
LEDDADFDVVLSKYALRCGQIIISIAKIMAILIVIIFNTIPAAALSSPAAPAKVKSWLQSLCVSKSELEGNYYELLLYCKGTCS